MEKRLLSRATSAIPSNSSQSPDHNKVNQDSRVLFVRRALIVFLLICIDTAAYAGTPQTSRVKKRLRGVVATQNAQRLVGATVEVVDSEGNSVAKSKTDSDGRFEILTDSPAGEYELIITQKDQLTAQQINMAQSELSIKVIVTTSAANELGDMRYAVSARQLGISEKTRARLATAQKEFEKGRVGSAVEQVQAAMEMSPSCSEAWSMRALMRLSARDVSGAIADAVHAEELDGTNADAFLALASAYNSSQMFGEAEAALRHALRLRPDSWQARLELAKTWYGEKRFALALRQLGLVERDFPDFHLVRANTLVSLGRKREGAAEFRMFLQEAPADRRALQIQKIVAQLDRSLADPD